MLDALMSSAALDRLLALLLAAAAGTGLLTLRAGLPELAWVFLAHGLVGALLLVAVTAKLARSLPRALRAGHPGRLMTGGLVALLALVSVAGGFASVLATSLVIIGPWTLLTWHVVAGIGLAVTLVPHLAPRRWRLLWPRRRTVVGSSPRLTRRSLLMSGALAMTGVGLWAGAEALHRLLGGVRRFTGSRWLPAGGIPPATTFFGDTVPPLDVTAWRLSVRGAVGRPVVLDLEALGRLGTERRRAVLDCTSGWVHETEWEGVSLGQVLALAGPLPETGHVIVRSATGWGAAIGLDEARDCFLATGVAGVRLPAANGAPCRLVAPRRRGLDWVKWVTEVDVRAG